MTTAVHTAVILAAGLGQRLGSVRDDAPKGLLRLGARSIIEESIEKLCDVGISRIIIGTGYGASHYEMLAASLQDRVQIDLVFNPDFAHSGSMHTLAVVAPCIESDVLLVESDLVYDARALHALQGATAPSAIVVSGFTNATDEVFVEADDTGALKALSKDRRVLGAHVVGELVGVSRIAFDTLSRMTELARVAFRTSLQLSYEDVLTAIAASHPVHCVVLPDLVWGEIDDAFQFERVAREVYPRVRRDRSA